MKATRFVIIGFAAAIIADTAAAAEEDQVAIDVYEGPMECDEADRVKVGDRLGMHYTGTIDGSSRTGEPGKVFDSSRGRDIVLDVTIGVGELIAGWDAGLLGLCRGAKAEEFGGPKMPWEMCLEMLHPHRNAEPTTLGLAVQWICQRPYDLEEKGQDNQGSGEL